MTYEQGDPDPHCLASNPELDNYHPGCCRFPKSCSPWMNAARAEEVNKEARGPRDPEIKEAPVSDLKYEQPERAFGLKPVATEIIRYGDPLPEYVLCKQPVPHVPHRQEFGFDIHGGYMCEGDGSVPVLTFYPNDPGCACDLSVVKVCRCGNGSDQQAVFGLRPPLHDLEAVIENVLIHHQRKTISGCECGEWGSHLGHMGESHFKHLATRIMAELEGK